jgi:23S rRNA pseudouridine1911/1915/1917 synthase
MANPFSHLTPPFPVVHEDENVLVIDKPAGIAVATETKTKEDTMETLLAKFHPFSSLLRSGLVHRLDKDTSGILLVAKDKESLSFFQKQFQEGKVNKTYLALVEGSVTPLEGTIETFIGRSPKQRTKQKAYALNTPFVQGKSMRKAVTDYRTREHYEYEGKIFSLIEAHPKTGRKHQLRAHFAFLSHPIVGDNLYGFKDTVKLPLLSRQFLHAYGLSTPFPAGQERKFTVDLPYELFAVLDAMKRIDY